ALTRAITQRTRAVLIAQLYGSLTPLDAVAALARARNLLLIEDCAQGYDGVYVGHPEADVSLFSFGPVKTAAALAGAVLRARDADLAARLRASQETWPTQCRWDYAKRLGQFAALKGLSSRPLYGAARGLARLLGLNVERLVRASTRSFRGAELI